MLLPFATLEAVTAAVPALVASGVDPLVLEYIDALTMAALTQHTGIDLGIPEQVKSTALAYLVVVIEGRTAEQVQSDAEAIGQRALELAR